MMKVAVVFFGSKKLGHKCFDYFLCDEAVEEAEKLLDVAMELGISPKELCDQYSTRKFRFVCDSFWIEVWWDERAGWEANMATVV